MSNILIIGGASGIGLEAVKFLCSDNDVFVLDKNPMNSEDVHLVSGYHTLNILDTDDIKNVFRNLFNLKHRFNHLVITAGGAHPTEVELIKKTASFLELDESSLYHTISLNLINQIILVQQCYKLFSKNVNSRNSNSITLTSSINSMGRYGLVAYSSAKAGLEGFVRSSAEDLGKLGIRINCVSPGSTRTPLTIKEGMDFESVKKQSLLDRVNLPYDIAQIISLLVNSSAITGQCLVCDSGQSLKSLSRY